MHVRLAPLQSHVASITTLTSRCKTSGDSLKTTATSNKPQCLAAVAIERVIRANIQVHANHVLLLESNSHRQHWNPTRTRCNMNTSTQDSTQIRNNLQTLCCRSEALLSVAVALQELTRVETTESAIQERSLYAAELALQLLNTTDQDVDG